VLLRLAGRTFVNPAAAKLLGMKNYCQSISLFCPTPEQTEPRTPGESPIYASPRNAVVHQVNEVFCKMLRASQSSM